MLPNIRVPLARTPQTVVEDLDLRRRSLAIMRAVTIRPEVRATLDGYNGRERRNQWLRTEGCRGLQKVCEDLAYLSVAGATHAELLLVRALIDEVIEDLVRATPEEPAALERAEMLADLEEDRLQGFALLQGETREQMLERARSNREAGARAFALARSLEHRVREQDLSRALRPAS